MSPATVLTWAQQQQQANGSADPNTSGQQQQPGSTSQALEQQEQQQQLQLGTQQAAAGACSELPSSSPAAASSSGLNGGAGTNLLPYGNTLHYPGCTCPAGWQAGSRVADQVDRLVGKAHSLYQQGLIAPQRKLRVCYMLPHHNITGGMKCLVEHIRLLRARGHYTIAVHRSDTAARAMPPWTTIEADADVVCSLHQRLADVYPVNSIDVVLVGIFHQVAELLAGVPAPVVYWEQGHEWLFGDPVRLQFAQNYLKQDQLFHTILHLPVVLAAVSSAVQDILQQEFGRGSLLIPNGIDCERFQPGPYEPLGSSSGSSHHADAAAAGEAGGVVGAAAAAAGEEAAGVSGGEAHSAEAAAAAGGMQEGPELVADAAPLGPEDAATTDCSGAMQTAAAAAAEGVAGAALDASAASMGVQQAAAAVGGEGSAATPMDTADITPTAADRGPAAAAAAPAPAAAAAAPAPAAALAAALAAAAAAPAALAAAAAAADGQHLFSLDVSDPHNPDTLSNQHQQQQSLVVPLPIHPAAAAAGRGPSGSSGKKRVLLVGNPALPLKGFPTAIAALTAVSAVLPIKIRWVCQVNPSPAMIPGLQVSGLDLETVVSPSQAQLPGLYKGHDVFLFTSRYEAWGMPVLEAMATGLPVVTTDCLGVRTFCRHGDNCLMGLPDDVAGLAQHLLLVLTDASLAVKLSAASRQTALQYTPEKVTEQLESVLYCLTAIGPDLLNLRRSCLLELQQACQRASEACSRPSAAVHQQQQQQLQRQRQLALQQLLTTHSRRQQQQQVAAAVLQQHQQQQQYQLQSLQVVEQLVLAAPQQQVVQLQALQQQLQHQQHQQEAAPPLQLSGLMPFILQQQQQQQQQSALLAFLQSSSRDVQQTPAASILQQQQQQFMPTASLFSQQLSQHLQLPTSVLMQHQQLQLSQQLLQAPSSLLMQPPPTSLLMLHQQQQQMLPQFQQQQQHQQVPRLQLPLLTTGDPQRLMLTNTSQHLSPSPGPAPASLQIVLQHLQQSQQQHDMLRLAQSQQPPLQHQQQLLSLQPQQQLHLQPTLLTPQQHQFQHQQQQQLQQLFTLFS